MFQFLLYIIHMGLPTTGRVVVQDGHIKAAFDGETWRVEDAGRADSATDKHRAELLVYRLNFFTPLCTGNHITAERVAEKVLARIGSATATIVEVRLDQWPSALPEGAVD